ncbi:MAG: DUF1415 domain-containing protein [Chitinophagaceae bacterium]|nr:DUF1415 domain-containing protein [Chitinophagaceae bacterium]
MSSTEHIIEQTKKWISDVVIGCQFCPFAAREMRNNSIHYEVNEASDANECLNAFLEECDRLDKNPGVETTLLILSNAVKGFEEYLDVLHSAEKLLRKQGYEGVYQIASFHPEYRFADSATEDPADYTNRSPHPMLQILREESVEKALKMYPNPELIPERNVAFAREKGIVFMKMLREKCI